jgi:alpha-tubulin suppressor-like RCC1 family protein
MWSSRLGLAALVALVAFGAGCKKKRPIWPHTTKLVLGGNHGCAIWKDGGVFCWGANDHGQLGDGTHDDRLQPVKVDLAGVKDIAAGARHTCAATDTSVHCWGDDSKGQSGAGKGDLSMPTLAVLDKPGARRVSAGDGHTCVLDEGGRVSCWGELKLEPTKIADAVDLASGAGHACVRIRTGQVQCWGRNDQGQLGDGTRDSRGAPVKVAKLEGVVQISLAGDHSCAVRDDGRVSCWGDNRDGALGWEGPSVATPTEVPGLDGIKLLAAGKRHACALERDNRVSCWGANDEYQLANGKRERWRGPTSAYLLVGVGDLAAGADTTCATLLDDMIRCWGRNDRGQMGDKTLQPHNVPMPIVWGSK